MRVFVSDKFSGKGLQILKQAPGLEVDYRPGLTGDQLVDAVATAEALIVRSSTQVTAELIAKAPKLRVVGRAGAGVDTIDMAAANQRGIVVMNTPGGNNVATGEHTIAMMMALSRKIPQAHGALAAGKWEKSKYMGVEVFRKTLGVLGFGMVGRIVVSRAIGLGMRVLVYDPFVVPDKIAEAGAVPATLDEIWPQADYISVHVPKGEKTLGMINAETIAKMKDGVRIINCARGGIVHEADLLAALQSGKVAGAALDVFTKEPITESPFFGLDNVVVTPHLGASTSEAQDNVAIAISEQVIDYLKNGVVRNAVNLPAIEPELLARMNPLLSLAGKMAELLGQLLDQAPRTLRLFLGGEFAAYPVAPVQTAALLALLPHFGEEEAISPVNAAAIAKSRGVELASATRETLSDYANVIGLKAAWDGGELEIQGSIPAPGHARIVKLGPYDITLEPEGRLLIISNEDVPGVVGVVGTLLGERKINIGQLRLGRIKDAKTALMVVTVDNDVDAEAMAALRKLPHVLSAKLAAIPQ
jgi:D-3-phosphoglycerate dehydrogenase